METSAPQIIEVPTHLQGNQIKNAVNEHEPNVKVDLKDGLVLQVIQVRDTAKADDDESNGAPQKKSNFRIK